MINNLNRQNGKDGGWVGGWYYYSNSIVLEISVEPYFLLEYNKHARTHILVHI